MTRPEIEPQHTDGDVEDQIWKAADKFCTYVRRRDASVTYHGPNECSDKKPWAVYNHFHVTVVTERRLGCDTLYNAMVALHRKKSTCHIPASQTTRFPASWANYLSQRPRVTWYSSPNDLIAEFTGWTMEEHIDRNVPLPANRKRLFQDAESTSTTVDPEDAVLHMRNGKTQKLYDYLAWQIREHNYSTREDLIDGALSRREQQRTSVAHSYTLTSTHY